MNELRACGFGCGVPPGRDDELVVVVFVVALLTAVLPSTGVVGELTVDVGATGGTVMPGMPILTTTFTYTIQYNSTYCPVNGKFVYSIRI